MPDVFISYPYKEREKAEVLASTLERHGLAPWLAHKDVAGPANLREQILNNLDTCRALVLIVQPQARPSNWLQLEYSAALESVWKHQDKILIPVLTGKGEAPVFLRHFQVWRLPDRRKDWPIFSEKIADIIKRSEKTNVPTEISTIIHLTQKWF